MGVSLLSLPNHSNLTAHKASFHQNFCYANRHDEKDTTWIWPILLDQTKILSVKMSNLNNTVYSKHSDSIKLLICDANRHTVDI
jgi:hypothetical protein